MAVGFLKKRMSHFMVTKKRCTPWKSTHLSKYPAKDSSGRSAQPIATLTALFYRRASPTSIVANCS
jgi:hypothetical protein